MNENNLVSVNVDTEHSITTGKSHTKIYLKMYVDAVTSGLIADMGAERWQTLCVLASFMDEKGECYPTQGMIAYRLNVSRQTANKRIKRLCEYRWQDKPLIVKEQARNESSQQWENNSYTILPISQLAIFDGEVEDIK